MWRWLISTLAVSLLWSCGGVSGAGSCFNLPDLCTDYGPGYTATQVQSSCKGPYSSGACPSANRVGRCLKWSGLPTEVTFSYYSPGWTAQSAQNECGQGQWLGL